MKRLLCLLFAFSYSIAYATQTHAMDIVDKNTDATQTYETQTYGYALVNDPDGFVNLREDESLQATIIRALDNGTVVSANCVDYTNDPNFCLVKLNDSQIGYVYRDRLDFFDDNADYIKVTKEYNPNPLVADYVDGYHNLSVHIEVTAADVDKEIIFDPYVEACPTLYKGICSYGLTDDSDYQLSYYKFDNIIIETDDEIITLTEDELAGLYIPEYAVNHNEVFILTEIYFNPDEQKIYLTSMQSYGALVYSVIFEINKNHDIKRYTWCEAV